MVEILSLILVTEVITIISFIVGVVLRFPVTDLNAIVFIGCVSGIGFALGLSFLSVAMMILVGGLCGDGWNLFRGRDAFGRLSLISFLFGMILIGQDFAWSIFQESLYMLVGCQFWIGVSLLLRKIRGMNENKRLKGIWLGLSVVLLGKMAGLAVLIQAAVFLGGALLLALLSLLFGKRDYVRSIALFLKYIQSDLIFFLVLM